MRDDVDACPDERGLPSSNMAQHGCPVDNTAVSFDAEGNLHLVISARVLFDTDQWRIKRASMRVLREVALRLDGLPSSVRVRVEGHTDDRATDEYNDRLSTNRAQAVLNWLVRDGHVAATRLRAVGQGEHQPAVTVTGLSEDTPAMDQARAANRRVEIVLERSREQPTDPAQGECPPTTTSTNTSTPAAAQ